MTKTKAPRLYTLDAMRGLAAIVVVIWHLPRPQIGSGYLAVDFFFALSGLVVAMAYEGRIKTSMSPGAFMLQRILRLYPLYAVGFVIGLAAAVAKMGFDLPGELGKPALLAATFFNAIMLPSPVGWVPFPINGPSWSLFLEMVINVAFCLALVRFRTWALVVTAAFSAAALLITGVVHGHLDQGWNWATMPGGLARVSFSFTVGMIIWRAIGRRRAKRSALWFLPPVALVAALLTPIPVEFALPYGFAAIFLIMPALVACGALMTAPPWMVSPSEFLGDISYPLYIVHRPMLVVGFVPAALEIQGEVWMPLLLLALVLFAWFLARAVDPRLRSLLRTAIERPVPTQIGSKK